MMLVGILFMLIGFIAKITLVWTLGILVLVVGAVLAVAGRGGHQVAGRRHWY